jgi:hypothetical protein
MQRLQSCRLGARSIPPSLRLPNLRSAYTPIPLGTSLDPRITRLRFFTSAAPRLSTPVQKTPITSVKDEIIAPAPPAPSSILDRLPAFAKPIKPYLELTRIDKPIGTLLLYWPCGESCPYSNGGPRLTLASQRGRSLWRPQQIISR